MTRYAPHPDPRAGDLVWVALAVPATPHTVWVIAEITERNGSKVEVRFHSDSSCVWLPIAQVRMCRP